MGGHKGWIALDIDLLMPQQKLVSRAYLPGDMASSKEASAHVR